MVRVTLFCNRTGWKIQFCGLTAIPAALVIDFLGPDRTIDWDYWGDEDNLQFTHCQYRSLRFYEDHTSRFVVYFTERFKPGSRYVLLDAW